jgi:adenylate cyclase
VSTTGPARTRILRRQLLAVMLVTAVIVPAFNVVTDRPTVRAALQGLLDAVLISLLVGGYLLLMREGVLRGWFRRRAFATNLVVNSGVALGLFLIGRAVGQVITTLQPRRLLTSFGDAHLVYALPFFVVVVVAVQFVLQMNRMIGASVLRYFVTGVYHRPRAEERIFLFLDLEGSTRLAEQLGSATYFELLRRFVDDLTEPVLDCEGEIYQYAGDEVVITWRHDAGVRRANCVRCFFAIRAAITGRAAAYEGEFGVVPRFHAGLHGGTVTAGELGDLRQQIVFVGDILNTAARLEEYAKRTGRDVVASGALLERLDLPAGIVSVRCGELELRGKGAPVDAYELSGASRVAR